MILFKYLISIIYILVLCNLNIPDIELVSDQQRDLLQQRWSTFFGLGVMFMFV